MTVAKIVAACAMASCLSFVPVRAEPPSQAIETGQPTLSLEDLDALLEEDEVEESVASLNSSEVADIIGIVVVLGFAFFSFARKSVALKYISFAMSIAYLGFYKSNLVSIVNIFAILQGNLPGFRHSIPWYLLIGFTVVSTVLWGRLYCGRICAFGALTQVLDRLLPSRLRIDPPAWLDRRLAYLKYGILGGVVV